MRSRMPRALAFGPRAQAHASLKSSSAASGAAVSVSPKDVTLTFNEKLEEVMSSVAVKDATGKDVGSEKAHVDASDPTTIDLPLPSLPTGACTVQWVAVGHDGHRRTGEFKFTAK